RRTHCCRWQKRESNRVRGVKESINVIGRRLSTDATKACVAGFKGRRHRRIVRVPKSRTPPEGGVLL
ncbi:hypothetical protein NSY56_27295, partial [Pseudomonas aeruginosa]|nr:hypothetical protein [Pseudomonas aeruginosa]